MEEYIPKVLRKAEILREVKYAIGIQIKHGKRRDSVEFGMLHGPDPNEEAMLDICGDNDYWIIRFNADGTDTPVWKWDNDRWLKVV